MLNGKIIGIGAAGNKAAAMLIKDNIIRKEDVILLNTTQKDAPKEYMDIFHIIPGADGCGKERKKAKNVMKEFILENKELLHSIMDPSSTNIIIVTSTEGGTGSGGSVILADYLSRVDIEKLRDDGTVVREKLNIDIWALTGFEDDGRGLKNTIEFFKDLNQLYSIHIISNKSFEGPRRQCEISANKEFCNQVVIEYGLDLVDSDTNIDSRDLTKVITTPGYTVSGSMSLTDIKNKEDFNAECINMLDNMHCLRFEPTAKRLAVMLQIHQRTESMIDDSFKVLKERLGTAYELYIHIQFTTEANNQWMKVIASGLKLPIEEISNLYENYKKKSSEVDKTKDEFFDLISGMNELEGDDEFDMFNDDDEPSSSSLSGY